jgi:hypothetical protein
MLFMNEAAARALSAAAAASSNKRVNQTAGISVALIAVKFSGRRWLPLALGN